MVYGDDLPSGMSKRREDLPFTKVASEPLAEWVPKHNGKFYVEGKVDGEDLLIQPKTGALYGVTSTWKDNGLGLEAWASSLLMKLASIQATQT